MLCLCTATFYHLPTTVETFNLWGSLASKNEVKPIGEKQGMKKTESRSDGDMKRSRVLCSLAQNMLSKFGGLVSCRCSQKEKYLSSLWDEHFTAGTKFLEQNM